MATNNDLIIDTSYTNKDFNTIYPELLDLVKKLTNKWDPSLSNESDPGVLLLKLNALIADKNNYNIDKNILECFPLSVTQEGNARRLYDSLGYQMHWYNSAMTTIGFQITDESKFTAENVFTKLLHKIPQFTYIVDDTGEVVYTILQDVYLYNSTDIVEVPAIEGKVSDYNNGEIITIANLDNDLRLYFEESHIAENGIFISNTQDGYFEIEAGNDTFSGWKRVDNLASYTAGSKVFQFGILPNSNTCYIQFPQDIANLLDGGLYIKYTISNGLNGNIKSNVLNTFYSDQTTGEGETTKVVNDYIRIIQNIPATDGADPETLSDAYTNFKRTVGTFNTLVTKKDYENFIYNYKNSNASLCSNIVVTDRTNDLNYTNYIQTWTSAGNKKVLRLAEIGGNTLNAYNIVFYALTAQQSVYDAKTYNATFKPNIDISTDIEVAISESKSAQHDILIPTTAQKYGYWNLYTIKGTLLTYRKITSAESKEIESNVKQKLFTSYNAKQVEYGVELDYNDLIETIVSADSRIKNVLLTTTSVTPVAYDSTITVDGVGSAMNDNLNNELVAKMVLSGNTQLFKFDDNFAYEFGQEKATVHGKSGIDTIKSITSTAEIDVPSINATGTNYYEVQKNEMIQVYAPTLVPVVEYSTYVKYWFEGSTYIKAGIDTILKDGDILHISYTDTNKVVVDKEFKKGSIINSSVDINSTIAALPENKTLISYLSGGQTIKIKALDQAELQYGTKFYFIMNNTDNKLEVNNIESNIWTQRDYILQENERFIYTNAASDEIIMLGSGTKLSMPEGFAFSYSLPRVDLQNIEESINELEWAVLDSSCISAANNNYNIADSNLITTGMDIRTFAAGTVVATPEAISLNNTPTELKTAIKNSLDDKNYGAVLCYKESAKDTEWSYIYEYPVEGIYWAAQSRLIINATPTTPQLLAENHTITIKYDITNEEESISGLADSSKYIMFNEPVILSGGQNLNAQVLNAKGEYEYTLKAYSFESSDIAVGAEIKKVIDIRNSKTSLITLTGLHSSVTLPFTFAFGSNENNYSYNSWLVPVYVNLNSKNATISFTTSSANGKVTVFNPIIETTAENDTETTATFTKSTDEDCNMSYILHITSTNNVDVSNLVVTFTGCDSNDYVNIGRITKLAGINVDEINDDTSTAAYKIMTIVNREPVLDNYRGVLKAINAIDEFDWTYKVNPADKVVNPTNASSYWNANHVYNAFTLPKIDFASYNITVNPANIT